MFTVCFLFAFGASVGDERGEEGKPRQRGPAVGDITALQNVEYYKSSRGCDRKGKKKRRRRTIEEGVCVLLLQDLLQSCARGGRRRVEDMCYERRRAGRHLTGAC